MARRDKIWAITLDALVDSDTLKRADVRDEIESEASMRTASRVWSEMESAGYLERAGADGKIWRRGERFEALLESGAGGSDDEKTDGDVARSVA